MFEMKTWTLPLAALLVAAPAAAHAPAIGPHGGLRLHWGAYHVELVPAGKQTELYLMRAKDEAPVPAAGTSATAKILAGGRISTANFAPASGNRLVAPVALSGDWRANVSVRLPGGSATLLFTAQAAGAARHAGH
ncbi:MAG: hypothetical protein C0474_00540 [Sphingobium sp.]|nr:hypothetical protein [Sphingobium sp.]